MNTTHPKTNSENGLGLVSHPEQLSKRANAYDKITERVIELLNKGTVPWQKPWNVQTSFPQNLFRKKPYRGINVFLLLALNYESPFWLTFNQAQQLGATIRKGEKACPVVFWKQHEVENKDTGEKTKIPFLRFYHVFNIAQCDGLKNLPSPSEIVPPSKPAEIVANMPNCPLIKDGMAKAFYSPKEDFIGIPNRERFAREADYFSTLFHELIHSTGHESRLKRATITENADFGSEPYGKEELIAEMGAAFLCGHAGIAERTIHNSAAYLQGWLKELQNDRTLIVHAAAQAQKAADFILNTKQTSSTEA